MNLRACLGLVDHFRIPTRCDLWMTVSLVDQRRPTVLDSIAIRGVRAEGHENHRMMSAQGKVHLLPETGAFPSVHFNARDDVVAHGLSDDGQRGAYRRALVSWRAFACRVILERVSIGTRATHLYAQTSVQVSLSSIDTWFYPRRSPCTLGTPFAVCLARPENRSGATTRVRVCNGAR